MATTVSVGMEVSACSVGFCIKISGSSGVKQGMGEVRRYLVFMSNIPTPPVSKRPLLIQLQVIRIMIERTKASESGTGTSLIISEVWFRLGFWRENF
jgi:hypothetical protein